MLTVHQEYLVDEQGSRRAVVVPVAEWERILEALEELEDIRAYDDAKSRSSDPVPFEEAMAEIRAGAAA